MKGKKRPGLAAFLSALWPGLGQIYAGRWFLGLAVVILHLFNIALLFQFIGLITAPITWVWGMVHAYRTVRAANARSGMPIAG